MVDYSEMTYDELVALFEGQDMEDDGRLQALEDAWDREHPWDD